MAATLGGAAILMSVPLEVADPDLLAGDQHQRGTGRHDRRQVVPEHPGGLVTECGRLKREDR